MRPSEEMPERMVSGGSSGTGLEGSSDGSGARLNRSALSSACSLLSWAAWRWLEPGLISSTSPAGTCRWPVSATPSCRRTWRWGMGS
jgi:hypothetical protein